MSFKPHLCFHHFKFTAYLSRLRVQNYCFTTYLPNILNTFLYLFRKIYSNLLIYRYAIKHKFKRRLPNGNRLTPNYLCVRALERIITWTILLNTRKNRGVLRLLLPDNPPSSVQSTCTKSFSAPVFGYHQAVPGCPDLLRSRYR